MGHINTQNFGVFAFVVLKAVKRWASFQNISIFPCGIKRMKCLGGDNRDFTLFSIYLCMRHREHLPPLQYSQEQAQKRVTF